MYDFRYNFIEKNCDAELLFTDADSLIISQALEYPRKLEKTRYISSFRQLFGLKKTVFPNSEKFKPRNFQGPKQELFSNQ